VLLVSQIGTVVAFISLGLAPAAWVLYAARILDGITGGNIIVAQAYVTDVTPPEKRSEALGMILAAFGISFFVGPALGGLALRLFGPRIPYLLAAVAALITLLITWRVLDESVEPAGDTKVVADRPKLTTRLVLSNRSILLVLLLGFLGRSVLGLLIGTFALFGEAVLFVDWDPESVGLGVGLILTTVGLSQFFTQTTLLRPALKHFGELRLIEVGVILRAAGMGLVALTSSPWLAAAGSAMYASGSGLTVPPTQSIATKAVDDSLRGGILGLYQSLSSLGVIVSTAIGGVLFAIDPFLPFQIGAVVALAALLPALALRKTYAAVISTTPELD